MKGLKSLALAAVGTSAVLASLAANAFSFSYVGAGDSSGSPVSGSVEITLTQINATTIDMFVVVTNTSTPLAQTQDGFGPRITAITFGWSPNLSLVAGSPVLTAGSSAFDTLTGSSNGFPGFDVDYCATSNNCTGGGGGGLYAGLTDPGFKLTWVFTAATTAGFLESWMRGTLDPELYPDYSFDTCLRFQTVGADGQDSAKVCTRGGGDEPVPEPGSLALLGLGLLGLAGARRRFAK